METRKKLTVGAELVRVTTTDVGGLKHKVEPVTVARVGRTYFYVTGIGGETKHWIDDWAAADYGVELLGSMADWADRLERDALTSLIAQKFSGFPRPNIGLRELRKMAELCGIAATPDASQDDEAHEIWAAAQLGQGESILDGVERVSRLIRSE